MTTGETDWDEHVALACYCYNTGVCAATGMTPYKAVFGVEPFEAWGELDLDRVVRVPESLAQSLAVLHRQLLGKALISKARAKVPYDKNVNPISYDVGDRVLPWSIELSKREGKKVVKPWLGPYRVVTRLDNVGYELKAETGGAVVRAHANRLHRIPHCVVETGKPRDGMFQDSLRMLDQITGTEMRKNRRKKEMEGHFSVRISGSRSATWTPERYLPAAVVKLIALKEEKGKFRQGVILEWRSNRRQTLIQMIRMTMIGKSCLGKHAGILRRKRRKECYKLLRGDHR